MLKHLQRFILSHREHGQRQDAAHKEPTGEADGGIEGGGCILRQHKESNIDEGSEGGNTEAENREGTEWKGARRLRDGQERRRKSVRQRNGQDDSHTCSASVASAIPVVEGEEAEVGDGRDSPDASRAMATN